MRQTHISIIPQHTIKDAFKNRKNNDDIFYHQQIKEIDITTVTNNIQKFVGIDYLSASLAREGL